MENTIFEKSLFSLEKDLNSNLGRSGQIANHWLNGSPVYVSTKTSGTGMYAQVIEIAILDSDLSVLFHTQVKPSVSIDDDAQRLHGINLSSLLERPDWSEVAPKVQQLLSDRQVIMFDALFDTRVIKQSCLAYNLSLDWVDSLEVSCAMALAVNAYGTDNRYGTVSIEYAMKKANIMGFCNDNGAVAATYALVNIVKIIAKFSCQLKQKMDQLSLRVAV